MIYFKLGYDFLSKIRLEKWQKQIDFGLEKSHTEKSNALLRIHCTVSDLITELIDKGVRVDVCNLGVLDNSSMSTLMRNILLSFAQFERDMIVERTQEGKAIARQNPEFREGRPKKYSKAQISHAVELLDTYSYKQVEAMTGISKSTLMREKRKKISPV